MEKNIFEGAKFGDKFVTRDGRVAVLISKNGIYPINNTLVIEDCFVWEEYSNEGYRIISYDKDCNTIKDDNDDIVSRYQEIIDENKLNKLAYSLSNEESTKWWKDSMEKWKKLSEKEQKRYNQFIGFNDFSDVLLNKMAEAFKAGYRKTMEE